ncbi:hemoglobin [Gallaecimonas pentaromativorans]|uniref:Hemoglobin n=1 Tax=Gallaecimonas pentaromativorans TaxID=584787 RepID=A0A3N1NGU9_9GAMM|nr:hemoglobin [Gallaecimonas pentaromativorans]
MRRLAETFYDIMATDPKAAELLAIHPQPMDSIRQRFFEFLSGWLGGPGLFEQKYGHPMLRARHMPFPVTQTLRDQWMYCMEEALNREVKHPPLKKSLLNAFSPLATHMINQ